MEQLINKMLNEVTSGNNPAINALLEQAAEEAERQELNAEQWQLIKAFLALGAAYTAAGRISREEGEA